MKKQSKKAMPGAGQVSGEAKPGSCAADNLDYRVNLPGAGTEESSTAGVCCAGQSAERGLAGAVKADLSSLASNALSGWAQTIHDLANVVTSMLIGAQALDWKLPPYSHLKRPVREMERNALRCGHLLKRLLGEMGQQDSQDFSSIPCGSRATAQEPEGAPGRANQSATGELVPAPVFFNSADSDLSHSHDDCCSGIFPKRDNKA